MRVLYAANNSINSKLQLIRFRENFLNLDIKYSAYVNKKFSFNIDWNLNSLLNINKPEHLGLDNPNFEIYLSQIKSWAPDLIISDLEFFTSNAALILNIPLWNYSSSLLKYGVHSIQKQYTNINEQYSFLLKKNYIKEQSIQNLIINAERNFICSHLGDAAPELVLNNNIEWVRPFYKQGKYSKICYHDCVAISLNNNRKLLSLVKTKDNVLFTECVNEYFNNFEIKEINNDKEYACNLYNSDLIVCEGESTILSDIYYNGKYCYILNNFNDPDSLLASLFNNKYNLSSLLTTNLTKFDLISFKPNLREDIYNLSRYLI